MYPNNDTVNIAFIGDSWAFLHKDHSCRIAEYLENQIHKPVRVYSFGINGLTSKEIYESMYENEDLRHFIQQKPYNYCYISAGINDTYKKMSTSYYKQSINCIIQLLLENHIHPIIQEIPDYDIYKAFDRQKQLRKVLRHISSYINDCPLDCKDLYRNSLNALIIEKNYKDKVSVLQYQVWNNNYQQDQQELYLPDGMHLNECGYSALDRAIATEITKLILK
jgi:lysophospholipase L1-like esterase